MNEVILTIWSDGQSSTVPLQNSRLTIGRGESADLRFNDQGLSRIHASFNRDTQNIWVLDEGSTNGTYVNGKRVGPGGIKLNNNDRITLGDTTKIKLDIIDKKNNASSSSKSSKKSSSTENPGLSSVAIAVAACVVTVMLTIAGGLIWYFASPGKNEQISKATPRPTRTVSSTEPPTASPQIESSKIAETPKQAITVAAVPSPPITDILSGSHTNIKLYKNMSPEEKFNFIYTKAKEIGSLIGNRSEEFPDIAITVIKKDVDAYIKRIGSGNKTSFWGEDLNSMFYRARTQFVPQIIKAFKAHNAPIAVGVYLPVIETGYHNIDWENRAHAAGLFQFIPGTAVHYGVNPSERTNIEKMAPAAARYINDNLAAFGVDSVGVGLSIAGYNRSPDSVRNDLQKILNLKNNDPINSRDFWNLIAHKEKLDKYFQGENVDYVPRFFAAAIIGENPWNFGLEMPRALTSYTEPPPSNEK